jgi:hypothetical protein
MRAVDRSIPRTRGMQCDRRTVQRVEQRRQLSSSDRCLLVPTAPTPYASPPPHLPLASPAHQRRPARAARAHSPGLPTAGDHCRCGVTLRCSRRALATHLAVNRLHREDLVDNELGRHRGQATRSPSRPCSTLRASRAARQDVGGRGDQMSTAAHARPVPSKNTQHREIGVGGVPVTQARRDTESRIQT